MNKISLLNMLLMAILMPLAMTGQTYFTQTTTNDFTKGNGLNVNIANDCVSLQQKMASVADWSATTNLPQTLESHQVVTWRNYVYCVGGFNGSAPVNTVYRATQQDNGISGWSSLNALPVALRDMGVAVTQTQLVVIGGRNSNTVSDKIYSASINADGSIGAWKELSVTLPQPCWGSRAVEALGNIYIIGGANTDSDNDATNKVYLLNVNAIGEISDIVEVNSLPEARNGHAVTMYDSKIIVTGGYDASHIAQNTVYSTTVNLDGTLGTWATKAPLTEAVYDHTTLCANGILTIIGGHNGSLPSNKFYYTNADATSYDWTLLDVMMPERYFRCASFAFGDKIFLCGGEATSGTVNNLVQYMAVTTSATPVKKSAFVGIPYYIGTPKTLQELNYTLTNPTSKTYEILYRTAGEDMDYGNWTSAGSNLPATINESKSYVQYMFRVTATGENDFSIDDVTLTVAGYKQLSGNLNELGDITLENSPYLVTNTISFTSGTHNIEPGVTIMFMPNTGLNIGQANVNFNGTQANPILLTAYETGAGSWNGVYFQDASDNGVTSVMNYTTIEKAGNGDNDANLRLYYTNQPTINNCTFKQAVGYGARFQNSSPTMTNCFIMENETGGLGLFNSSPICNSCSISDNYRGLHLDNSAPTCNNCTMSGNRYAGIYFATTNFNATFNSVTCSGNRYGMYSCSPNRSFTFDASSVAFADNIAADIAVAGGQIGSDQTWNNYAGGYTLLGNVEVYGGTPKLTLRPGVTIKGNTSCGLYVGRNSNQGGMLYAVGTAAAPITFTSLNGEVGGWNGVRFRDGSDYSSNSSMRYCVVEKATTNLVCESTNQPSAMWCTFQEAQNEDVYLNSASISIEGSTIKNATKGLWVNSSAPTLVSVVFENMSECCVYHNNECTVTYSDCTMKDSQYGIRYWTPDKDMVNDPNIVFENLTANIAVPSGHIQTTHSWEANIYAILGELRLSRVYWDNYIPRLTLMPGTVMKFAEGARMEISGYYSSRDYYGELYAEGTEDWPITFTSLNGEVGGWNGLVFSGQSDDFVNASSSLKHCIIENGNEYNLHLSGTNQPGVIEDCVFRNSAQKGVYMYDSYDTIRNCSFENNAEYALYYNNGHYVGVLEGLTFTGNLHDGVTMNGGHIGDTRTWNAYTYFILGELRLSRVYWDNYIPRLTLMPGTVMKFAAGARMEISGYYSNRNYYGELYAEGTEEQPILFTSMNGESGGWIGLVFNGQSDDFENASSSLKHCIIEKGNEYNLYMGGTNQPGLIENCVFRNSAAKGVYMSDSYDTIRNCSFENNAEYALYYNNAHYVGVLENLTFTGNLQDGVTVNGGHIGDTRTWNAYTYFILGELRLSRVYWDNYIPRLTLMPGTVMKFAAGARMEISGYYSNRNYYGELYAEGTEDRPITFTSLNGEVGGWNGLVFPGQSDDFANASSSLKHCIIEKGNEYNLYIQGTTLPEIENSIFQNSNGFGVRIGNEYNRTIKNSVFKNNASHGIYIVETTPFTLGGAPEYANNIYNNGGYAVYQDGGSNLNMTYNFWGEIGSKAIDDNLIYDQKDNSSKGRITFEPVSWFPVENFAHLQGTFSYDGKPMSNCEMNVVSTTDSIMAAANTNANGTYDFRNYTVGVYNTLDDDFGIDILAGVNATDALLAMRHFVQLDTLTDARLAVADVNQSGSVNGTDAMLILRRAVDGEFPSGNFYFYNPSNISIGGDTCHYDLSFLCFGDVNGSYNPQSREQSMALVQEGSIVTDSYQELEIPVSLKTAVEIGALTLRIGYSAEYLQIEDVVMAATGESLLFTANDGELWTAWYNLNAMPLDENDGLVIIKARANDLSLMDEPVFFSLSPYSELADGSANVIEGVVIAMPKIVTETMGVGNHDATDDVRLALYPNPANDVCRLAYQLPEAGRVTVAVYNMMGQKVMDAAGFHQDEGKHELQLSVSDLAAGVYNCRVTFEGESSWVKSTLIIIEK